MSARRVSILLALGRSGFDDAQTELIISHIGSKLQFQDMVDALERSGVRGQLPYNDSTARRELGRI